MDVATVAPCWDSLPQAVRNNIDFKVDHWRRNHKYVGDRTVAKRKMAILLPDLRRKQTPAYLFRTTTML